MAMLEGRPDDAPTSELDVELEPSNTIVSKPPPGVVRCPVCKQVSYLLYVGLFHFHNLFCFRIATSATICVSCNF